ARWQCRSDRSAASVVPNQAVRPLADATGPRSVRLGPASTAPADRSFIPRRRWMVVMRSATVDDRSLPEASEPHETKANSVLRPIVFGANDGLVSNLALVMGVAGATSDNGIIVLAGV